MLVVDFMHEFELGVWKNLFMHLIRILYVAAPGGKLVAVLDERCDDELTDSRYHVIESSQIVRYRAIPQYGEVIRRFANNASEMKKLAAHDFEDLLQVRLHPGSISP